MSNGIKESVSFAVAMLCKTHRYVMDDALRTIEQCELRVGQEMLLLRLWEGDGVTQSQLVERMQVEPPTVTKMLQRLEALGLVERRSDPDDARISRVFLTAAGRAAEPAAAEAWHAVDARATAGMSTEERLLLRRLLVQMRDNLCDHG